MINRQKPCATFTLSSRLVISTAAIALTATATSVTIAGGGPENTLLIIDPTIPESMEVGNYYKNARNIPDENVVYLSSSATNYADFVANQNVAFLGLLANRDLFDHIDYVVVAPGAPYRIPASGYISDSCASVNHFAISSCYTMAFLTDDILNGLTSTERNQYALTADLPPVGFDSEWGWVSGSPTTDGSGQRLFAGALLGYTGNLGNTPDEIMTMIDRSVAVDGTFPTGTFYFMETNDQARSGPRHGTYPSVTNLIISEGGQAEHRCCDSLPLGEVDCMGIMTGRATPGIDGANLTILPGAFCDHLTSFAGHFDSSSQEKMSRWITEGAAGTWGTVEEPCNYPAKFPHSFTHLQYFRGMSLGEAVLRNVTAVPFQGLFLGDPLTRPYAYIPDVTVPDAPTGSVSGIIDLTPEATNGHPVFGIGSFDFHVSGFMYGSVDSGESFALDTTRFDDGWHALRVIGFEDTDLRTTGSWVGELIVDNHGQSTSITQVNTTTGDLSTAFTFDFNVVPGIATIEEARLLQNGRVVATNDGQSTLTVHGRMLGTGDSSLRIEALLSDGSLVSSPPTAITVSDLSGSPLALTPIAFDYSRPSLQGKSMIVQLPATYDDASGSLEYTIVDAPANATVHAADASLPYRIVTVDAGATGTDSMTFEVSDGTNTSNLATVSFSYRERNVGHLELEVGDLRSGKIGTFTATGGYPNDNTYLVYSLKGEASTPVPALNITLNLKQPKQAGSTKKTDANGTVVWNLPMPNITIRKRVFLQVAQKSLVSEMIWEDLLP